MTKDNKKITAEEVIDRYADMVYRLALLRVKIRLMQMMFFRKCLCVWSGIFISYRTGII